MNHNVHKVAACSVALSALVIGCTPVAQSQRPMSLAAASTGPEKESAGLSSQAQAAVRAGKFAEALPLAERAVELSPRDVGYRMLLGDLYLKNGRFTSAETSFSDVVTLDPGNVRGTLSLALSLVAQGKTLLATTELEKLEGSAQPGDLGLAYALAGRHERARALLEQAASAPNASGRVRQNLALAYALAGDWQKARVTAAKDVSPAELNTRLEHWATLANPASSYTQVASLLGVTAVEDSGQPLRLALASPEPTAPAYADADSLPPPVESAPPAPVAIAAITPAPAAPVETVPAAQAPTPLQLAAAAESLVAAGPALIKASLPVGTLPIPAFKPVRSTSLDARPRRAATGRYVVQIGAYRNLGQAERAWEQVAGRFGIGSDKHPLSTTVTLSGRGTFHRLSVAPFQAPGEAIRACKTIRARGGACFVRTVAGDAPLQYAARNARRGD